MRKRVCDLQGQILVKLSSRLADVHDIQLTKKIRAFLTPPFALLKTLSGIWPLLYKSVIFQSNNQWRITLCYSLKLSNKSHVSHTIRGFRYLQLILHFNCVEPQEIQKIANKLMTLASGEINLQSKHDLICRSCNVSAFHGWRNSFSLVHVMFASSPTFR